MLLSELPLKLALTLGSTAGLACRLPPAACDLSQRVPTRVVSTTCQLMQWCLPFFMHLH